jgi:hypothetical protein
VAHGWRGYTYWLSSPDFELMLGRSAKFPAVVCQLHAAYLHSVASLGRWSSWSYCCGTTCSHPSTSCWYPVWTSIQGWVPVLEDLHRFVGYGHNRRGFEEHNEAFTTGDRLTGLMFGRDALVARLYDKSQEIRQRGVSWLPDLWGVDGRSEPAWRLEFQFRRKVLIEFQNSKFWWMWTRQPKLTHGQQHAI